MTTEQDILAGRVNAALEEWDSTPAGQGPAHVATHVAATVLAAGYRKPRIINTAEELEQLLEGAVILSERTGDSAQKDHEGYWYLWGGDTGLVETEIDLPVAVLHEPKVRA